jgi:hypothetical protein
MYRSKPQPLIVSVSSLPAEESGGFCPSTLTVLPTMSSTSRGVLVVQLGEVDSRSASWPASAGGTPSCRRRHPAGTSETNAMQARGEQRLHRPGRSCTREKVSSAAPTSRP